MYQHHVEKYMSKLRKRFPEARIAYDKDITGLELWHIQYTDGYVTYTDTFRFDSDKMILVNSIDNCRRSN
jgi:hypothetical protein